MLCQKCKRRKAKIKGLCKMCYGIEYRKVERGRIPVHKAEMEFAKNYFNHENWVYLPAAFKFNLGDRATSYMPDFYDGERGVFIEVIGTRQTYSGNREKYAEFRKIFSLVPLEFRSSDGSLCRNPEGEVVAAKRTYTYSADEENDVIQKTIRAEKKAPGTRDPYSFMRLMYPDMPIE